jgi:ribosome-binding factor A
MRKARIFYSCSNQETQRQKIAHALDKAKGYVRTYLGETLSLKFVPELIFEYDRNLDYVERVYKILDSVKKDSEETTEVSPIVDEDEEGEAEDREQARPAPKEA